jgi:hypothetical protein
MRCVLEFRKPQVEAPPINPTLMSNLATDPERLMPESLRQVLAQSEPARVDPVSKYGAPLLDSSGKWLRHFVDVRGGKAHTLCGLELVGVDRRAGVSATCPKCADEHTRLRGGW